MTSALPTPAETRSKAITSVALISLVKQSPISIIFRTTPSQILYTAPPAQDRINFEPTLPVHNDYYLLIDIIKFITIYINCLFVFTRKNRQLILIFSDRGENELLRYPEMSAQIYLKEY